MAVRTALGASRLRLVRQLFLEAFVLAAIGGIGGIALARSSISAMRWFAPAGIPRLDEVAVDGRVVAFAVLASVIAGLLAGIAPAFQGSTTSPALSLKSAGPTASADRQRQRLRAWIVGFEVAAAVVLLVGSGLLLRSFSRVLAVDLGFDADKLLVVRMRLDGTSYGGGGAHP